MKLNAEKIDERLAKLQMTKIELSRRAGRSPGWVTILYLRAQAGRNFNPKTVGELAKALKCKVSDIGEAA